jgi:hypothetical protein
MLLNSLLVGLRSRAALQAEIIALRHQLTVLQRTQIPNRLLLNRGDRCLWVSLSRLWSVWRSVLLIVNPETVISWHRQGFRWYRTWRIHHARSGRPCVPKKTCDLIRTISRKKTFRRQDHAPQQTRRYFWAISGHVEPPSHSSCRNGRTKFSVRTIRRIEPSLSHMRQVVDAARKPHLGLHSLLDLGQGSFLCFRLAWGRGHKIYEKACRFARCLVVRRRCSRPNPQLYAANAALGRAGSPAHFSRSKNQGQGVCAWRGSMDVGGHHLGDHRPGRDASSAGARLRRPTTAIVLSRALFESG